MGNWHLAAAEIQGHSHKKTGVPCQDKTFFMAKNDVSVIALADGAGSAKNSHYAAELVTHTIGKLLTNSFDMLYRKGVNRASKDILDALLGPLEAKASALDCQTSQLASTLLAIAVKEGRYIAIHIGDGVIGALGNKAIEVLSKPDNGELANETVFLTSGNAIEHLRIYKGHAKKYSGFILMSDGTAFSLYDKRKQSLTKATIKLFYTCKNESNEKMCELLSELLEEQLSTRTDDDCSIAIMARDKRRLNDLYRRRYGAQR